MFKSGSQIKFELMSKNVILLLSNGSHANLESSQFKNNTDEVVVN